MRTVTLLLRHTLVLALAAAIAVGPAAVPRAFADPVVLQRHPGNGLATVGSGVQVGDRTVFTITAPNGSIINYSDFNIHEKQDVVFIQGGANNRALNRVFSGKPTEILGTLKADGHIYIVNPAGVVFGAGSVVNANGIHAAAGHMSDKDFKRGETTGVDHYTGLRGTVDNQGEITARAVSLVGMRVTNSNSIRADGPDGNQGGWIILAAGRDVLIGRDGQQNGVLLRIEGAASALFDKNATGVKNTGSLVAKEHAESTAPDAKKFGGGVTLGAGDLYGTAIFSNGAIEARKLALAADNRGNVALGGPIQTQQLEAKFAGNTTGELRGTEPGATQTIHTDSVTLTATGDRGNVKVGDGLAFRGAVDPADPTSADKGPKTIIVEQKANLASSDLAGLSDFGAARADTTVKLTSTGGAVALDDRALVNGTQLELGARTFVDVRSPEVLDVDSLKINALSTFSNADLVARGAGGIDATTNIGMVTRKPTAQDPSPSALISAHQGKLRVSGDITTSDGGGLRLEAKQVELGSFDEVRGPRGGIVDISGSVQPHLEIGFTDAAGVQQTQSVTLNAINTEGRRAQEDAPRTAGGDVIIHSLNDVTVRTSISTRGEPGTSGQPLLAGGSVSIDAGSGSKITVGSITTGGAEAPAAGAPEQATISLNAGKIVGSGNFDTRGVKSDGSQDRRIDVNGELEVATNKLSIFGGDVNLDTVTPGPNADGTARRTAAVAVTSAGATTISGPVALDSLEVTSLNSGPVLFGGSVRAESLFRLKFQGAGVGRVGGVDGVSGPIDVTSHVVSLSAQEGGAPDGTTASLAIDPSLHFTLLDIDKNPDPRFDNFERGTFSFHQDAAIDASTTSMLFAPDPANNLVQTRFTTISPVPFDPANPVPPDGQNVTVHDDLVAELVNIDSNGSLSLDAAARSALTGTDLAISSASFEASGAGPFNLAALDLRTGGDLTVNFDVTATDKAGITLGSGADGKASKTDGTGGSLTVTSNLNADSINLLAGTGGSGSNGAKVSIDPAARLRAANGSDNAKLVSIRQDADIDSATLPATVVFGSLDGLDYQLRSLGGGITLSSDTAVAGSKLSLTAKGDIKLGTSTDALQLASLFAKSNAALSVARAVTTGAGGKIELHSGADGGGNLTLSSALSADEITLVAGNGSSSSSRVVINQGTQFLRTVGPATSAPTKFTLEQDAPIGDSTTKVPTQFGGPIAGMSFTLRSRQGTVSIATPDLVKGTQLVLDGTSVSADGALVLQSLDTKGAATFLGDVTATGDILLQNGATLTAKSNETDIDRPSAIRAGGDLTSKGAIKKSSAGTLLLHADQDLVVTSVSASPKGNPDADPTVPPRFELTVEGGSSVKTGVLDASAKSTVLNGGAVQVTSGGQVDVAGINTTGFSGTDQHGSTAATNGTKGGEIEVTGSRLLLGALVSAGGDGGALEANRTGFSSHGGDGGAITLTANDGPNGGAINLSGDLRADGGRGFSNPSANPPDAQDGAFGDVTLKGNLRLASTGTSDRVPNTIHGNNVSITGDVQAGFRAELDPTTPATETPVPVASTGLTVVADNSLVIGGDIATGDLDLELHNGNLDLGTKTIHADTVRLAASDGHFEGSKTESKVLLSGLSFAGANGTSPVKAFTLEQDASIGDSANGGTAIPLLSIFGTGTRTFPFSLGLISQDGSVALDAADVANVNGTNLLLAANGKAGDTDAPIRVTGTTQRLVLPTLTLGTEDGVGGTVGGDTRIESDLEVGRATDLIDTEVLRAGGDLHVQSNLILSGSASFVGTESQRLTADGGFTLDGSLIKSAEGDFEVFANDILFASEDAQSIANDAGTLLVSAPLVKDVGNLALRGVRGAEGDGPAITVRGVSSSGYALETRDGNLSISASQLTGETGSARVPGTYQLDGGVRAVGDLSLGGRAVLQGSQSSYRFEAARAKTGTDSGLLTMGGIASANGDVTLVGAGHAASIDDPEPAAVRLGGDFALGSHALFVDGVTEVVSNSAIDAGGNVEFHSLIKGADDLAIQSGSTVVFHDDVAMTGGAFSARGDTGVRFVSAEQDEQLVQAGSITLGNGAAPAPSGRGSLLRDGDLRLNALGGNVTIGRGQRLIVNGDLDVSAAQGVVLADTSALGIDIHSGDIGVYGGSTLVANSIFASSAPRVIGGGGATFAVPTRTEISSNIPSDQVLVRAISATGEPISFESPDNDGLEPPFPMTADFVQFDPTFPSVTGSAIFDYARIIPQPLPQAAITRPHADPIDLEAALELRPLWAEELLAYLELRSVEAPDESGKRPEAEHLPPVGARPGETLEPSDARVRIAAVENAVAVYRDLFRPELRRDPDTGVIDAPSHTAEIRESFQGPIDALRAQGGGAVAGTDVARLVESDSSFDAARRYRNQLATLLDVSQRALTPDQRPRFKALVLSDLTPSGISPEEFNKLF